MEKKQIQSIELKNHLILTLYDASRDVGGGRWFIRMIAEIDIPVDAGVLAGADSSIDLNDIREVLGETVKFEQKRERIFVDVKDKDKVFKEICDFFLENAGPYLSHETFPRNYILKTYRSAKEKQSWYKK